MAAGRKGSPGEFSVELSNVLDVIGYSKELIKNGQRLAKRIQDDMNHTNNNENHNGFLTGSKKEGMSFHEMNSDYDFMWINDKVRCFQSDAVEDRPGQISETYVLDFQGVPPGYAMLEIDELPPDYSEKVCVYSIDSNKTYYSSKRLNSVLLTDLKSLINLKESVKPGPVLRKQAKPQLQSSVVGSDICELLFDDAFTLTQNGPAQAKQMKQPFESLPSTDNVIAFPAHCKKLKKLWLSRTRYNGFPSTNQIEKISKMDAHVVPVGCKNSEAAYLQWRICFTFGEIKLLQSLNGTQYHLYALLRFLAKDVIKPICPGVITSYVMKNVVLWMAELKPMSYFTEGRLEQCLTESVHFLHMCLTNGFMPNYMIASRNLFQNRLSPTKEVKLRTLLKTLVSERGYMVLRCDTIRLNMMSSYTKDLFGITESRRRMHSEMFDNPGVKKFLNAMDSAFPSVISSIEESFTDKLFLGKFDIILFLKYVNTWIISLPVVSPEQIHTRSCLRQQCLDLRKRISVSFVRESFSHPTLRQLKPPILSLIAAESLQTSEEFVSVQAERFLKIADYLGGIDERKVAELMANPMQMMQLIFGGSRSPSTTQKMKECVDIDLD